MRDNKIWEKNTERNYFPLTPFLEDFLKQKENLTKKTTKTGRTNMQDL